MNNSQKIKIMYFTDVLCVWAYLAQIRIDELKTKFGASIELQNHFFPVFGSVNSKMEQNWSNKGGASAYNKHVRDITSQFNHIVIHPDLWIKNVPTTSVSCHLFLKAIQLLEQRGELSDIPNSEDGKSSVFEAAIWELRLAFFKDLIDISNIREQFKIAETLGLPIKKIEQLIASGAAFAALDDDIQLKEKYNVLGSPTLVLNEGRQIIYGNVGYRVIEANVQELLHQPVDQVSWC